MLNFYKQFFITTRVIFIIELEDNTLAPSLQSLIRNICNQVTFILTTENILHDSKINQAIQSLKSLCINTKKIPNNFM